MDILDYIKWRGDLTFEEREFNEVDSLVFCAISYEQFDKVFFNKNRMTIKELSDIFFSIYDEDFLENRKIFSYRSYEILKAMSTSIRYQSLIMFDYVNEIDYKENSQFSAMTIQYKNKWKYIAFRGTDDTIVGWKEDFIMLYRDRILAQEKAVWYLKNATKEENGFNLFNKTMNYYVGGHSKGGHLAIFSSIHMPLSIQEKIKKIYNFDGPGLKEELWNNKTKNLIPKIFSYIPTDSFFGRLFTHKGNKIIVHSKERGLLQHSIYNWMLLYNCIDTSECMSQSSDTVFEETKALLDRLSLEEKKLIVDSSFSVFENLGIHNISDLLNIDIIRLIKALKQLRELDDQTKTILIKIIRLSRTLSK